MAKRSAGKRELIDTGKNTMYGKRDVRGKFSEMDDVARSSKGDRRTAAKRTTKSGYGDQGDRKRAR